MVYIILNNLKNNDSIHLDNKITYTITVFKELLEFPINKNLIFDDKLGNTKELIYEKDINELIKIIWKNNLKTCKINDNNFAINIENEDNCKDNEEKFEIIDSILSNSSNDLKNQSSFQDIPIKDNISKEILKENSLPENSSFGIIDNFSKDIKNSSSENNKNDKISNIVDDINDSNNIIDQNDNKFNLILENKKDNSFNYLEIEDNNTTKNSNIINESFIENSQLTAKNNINDNEDIKDTQMLIQRLKSNEEIKSEKIILEQNSSKNIDNSSKNIDNSKCYYCKIEIKNLNYYSCKTCTFNICFICQEKFNNHIHKLKLIPKKDEVNYYNQVLLESEKMICKLSSILGYNLCLSFKDIINFRNLIKIYGEENFEKITYIFIYNRNKNIFEIQDEIELEL